MYIWWIITACICHISNWTFISEEPMPRIISTQSSRKELFAVYYRKSGTNMSNLKFARTYWEQISFSLIASVVTLPYLRILTAHIFSVSVFLDILYKYANIIIYDETLWKKPKKSSKTIKVTLLYHNYGFKMVH